MHQLVAETFLNHTTNGYLIVVNHKDNNPKNNKVSNLELVTQRENVYTHHKGSSKYKGVSKLKNKWVARMWINNKSKYLGSFDKEEDAYLAYQNKLITL